MIQHYEDPKVGEISTLNAVKINSRKISSTSHGMAQIKDRVKYGRHLRC